MTNIVKQPHSGAWIYLPLMLAVAGLGVWAVRSENDFSFYWRDPAAIVNTGPWIGLFSNIGIFIWWIAAAVSVFTALLIWNLRGEHRMAVFLLAWGLFTGFLALDDFFMIHEWVVPTYLPLSDSLMFGVYAVLGAGLVLLFRSELLATPVLLLVLAAGCFGLSLLVDLIGPARFLAWGVSQRLLWSLEYVVEDGLKLLGIIAWAHYLGLTSYRIVRSAINRQGAPTNGRSAEHTRQRAKVR